jgi:8-oxo-dGTP pyrophosphatase MutT (NUDIX family)
VPERSGQPRVAADVAVFAYLNGAMHVLLVRRRYEPYESYWALPGGGIEADETLEEAAVRELREETGLDATPLPISTPFTYLDITVHTFLVEVAPGWEPELNEEHDDYRWLARDDAVELLYWPEPKELLRGL